MVDPRVAGAGIAMAIGMMALLPTFNALNNSYLTDVQPPPWMPTPDDLPDDFKPPEDWEPPEGWEPPPDMEPPPGWEPPPGYDGPIPEGGCPPPIPMWFAALNGTRPIGTSFNGDSENFEVPPWTVAVIANVTFREWQASSVTARLVPPVGDTEEQSEDNPNPGGILVPATPVAETPFTFQMVAQDEDSLPPSGRYTIEIEVEFAVSGSYSMEAIAVVACGGMLQ